MKICDRINFGDAFTFILYIYVNSAYEDATHTHTRTPNIAKQIT